jgi:signal transduction histidine kinase
LAIVYKIIEDHGGHIEVSSDIGKGASFVIRIPCDYREKNGGINGSST